MGQALQLPTTLFGQVSMERMMSCSFMHVQHLQSHLLWAAMRLLAWLDLLRGKGDPTDQMGRHP